MDDIINQNSVPYLDIPIEELKDAIAYLSSIDSPAVRYGGVLRTIANQLVKAANIQTGEDHKPRTFMSEAEKERRRVEALKDTMSRDINKQRSDKLQAILAGKHS